MTDKNKKKYVIFALIPLFFLSCGSDAPVLSSIDPKIGRMGEIITLTGKNFGNTQEDSFITIAGISPTGSSYQIWQDDLIVVRVPESGESGLVYVFVRGLRSNGVLFTNTAAMPRPVDGEEPGMMPRIVSIEPQTGFPGSLITISGSNFGNTREGSGVFFSRVSGASSLNPFSAREPEFIEVSDLELGYEFWSVRELQVRVPDGVTSGNIEVRTPLGNSRPVFFDVSEQSGFKTFKDKHIYTIYYSVDIRVLEATRPNALYLWMPVPVTSSSQRNVSLNSSNITPFIENHRGVSLFKLENVTTGTNHTVNLSFNVEVFTVETEVRSPSLRQERTPLFSMYTQNTNLIPSSDPLIRSTVNAIIGREQNPHNRARLLYNWIINEINIRENLFPPVSDIVSALEQREADAYGTALLYTAMARAAGLPSIPVAGVLINDQRRTHRHYWTEIWIDSIGWIPVDPVMGAGAVPGSFIMSDDPANYYFGNLDNRRITFSRGEVNLSQMESRGRVVSRQQSYSLQNIWEEASGGLENYTSLWGDILITGLFLH